jgi:hypothetical protein
MSQVQASSLHRIVLRREHTQENGRGPLHNSKSAGAKILTKEVRIAIQD